MRENSFALLDSPKIAYSFSTLRLEADGTLLRGGVQIHLAPKELAALRLLLENAGQIVTPTQLRKALWDDVHVSAESIPRCISSLRAALMPEDCIQTVYKRGYRFNVPVEREEAEPAEPLPRLAVVPFSTGLNVPDYLGAAIAEETIVHLSGGPSSLQSPVSMLARDSAFSLARQGRTAHQVGEVLEADLVLAGSLRALPAHYRLRAEMIRVEDGAQIWVEDFLAAYNGNERVESELVERLVSRLSRGGFGISLAASEEMSDVSDARREAYEHYQRGHQELQAKERQRIPEGLRNLKRAAELDPSLIAAQIDLLNACISQTIWGYLAPAAAAEIARRTARELPEQSEAVVGALPALGWVHFHLDHNIREAQRAFDESSSLPHNDWTTRSRVQYALSLHRFDEAIGVLEEALLVDPYSPCLQAALGWAWHLAGDATRSRKQMERTLALFPENEVVNLFGPAVLGYNGKTQQALDAAEGMVKRSPNCDPSTAVLAYTLARAGRTQEARDLLERLQWLSRERYVSRSFSAAVYVELGEPDNAIEELRAAEEARCPWFFQMLADPRLKPLEHVPEFVSMQERLAQMEIRAAGERADEA